MLEIFSPVSAGAAVPDPYRRFSVPDAVDLSLFTGSACNWNFWATALAVPLLYTDAIIKSGCELYPLVEVAVPVAGRVSVPPTFSAPFTSRVTAGVVVPMPIFAVEPLPVCVIVELWMLVAVVHNGREFTVPPVVVTFDVTNGESEAELEAAPLATPVSLLTGKAMTNADGGNPPTVSASAAFIA